MPIIEYKRHFYCFYMLSDDHCYIECELQDWQLQEGLGGVLYLVRCDAGRQTSCGKTKVNRRFRLREQGNQDITEKNNNKYFCNQAEDPDDFRL